MPKLPDVEIPVEFEVLPHEALVNVWWTGTLLKRASRRFFRDTKLTEAEFNLLVLTRHAEGPLSQVDLSRRMLANKSNVTGLVDQLEERGLIERRHDPEDRRRYHIVLTEDGRREIDAVDPVYYDMVRRVMSPLSDAQCRQLVDLMRSVREGLASALAETDPDGGSP